MGKVNNHQGGNYHLINYIFLSAMCIVIELCVGEIKGKSVF